MPKEIQYGSVDGAVDLIKEIALGLERITSSGKEYPSSAVYTDALVRTFAEMGSRRGYDAHPDPTRVGFYKEYLFDASWWHGSELIMAAESEWGRWTDVSYDFPKLLVAKARLKILLTDAGSHGVSRDRFKERLGEMLQVYERHIARERYLWIDLCGNLTGGDLFGFEATIAGNGKCPDVFWIPILPERIAYQFRSVD